jgi:hypothetical protein
MDDGTLIKIVVSALVPGTIAGLLLLVAWWRHKWTPEFSELWSTSERIARGGEPFWIMVALPLAIVPALLLWVTGAKSFPPASASQWVPLVVVVAGFAELAVQATRAPRWVVHAVRLIVLALAGYVCSKTYLRNDGAGSVALHLGSFTFLSLAMAWVADEVTSRTRGFAGPTMLVVTIGAATQLLGLGLSNLFVSLGLTGIASILGAAAVVAFMRKRFSLAFGGAFVPVAALAAVTFIAFLSNKPAPNPDPSDLDPSRRWIYVGAIAASVLLPGLSLLPRLRDVRGLRRAMMLIGLAGLPLLPALGVMGMDQLKAKEAEAEGGYEYSLVAPVNG